MYTTHWMVRGQKRLTLKIPKGTLVKLAHANPDHATKMAYVSLTQPVILTTDYSNGNLKGWETPLSNEQIHFVKNLGRVSRSRATTMFIHPVDGLLYVADNKDVL